MNHVNFPSEYFFNTLINKIYIKFTTIITILTLILSILYFYTIFTQSKKFKLFRWLLLNHSIWCILLVIMLCIAKPCFLFPATSGFSQGIFKNLGTRTTAIFGMAIILSIAIFSVGGMSMTIIHRYSTIFFGKFRTIFASKISFIFYGILHFCVFVPMIIHFSNSAKIDKKKMIENALNYNSIFLRYSSDPTFVFIDKSTVKHLVIIALILLILILFGFCIVATSMILELKKFSFYKKNNIQLYLISKCLIQIVITVIFQFLPLAMFLLFCLFDVPYSGPIINIMLCLLTSHSFIEMLTTLYFIKPYRLFTVNLFYQFFLHQNVIKINSSLISNNIMMVQKRLK